jgi:hypothetical protein
MNEKITLNWKTALNAYNNTVWFVDDPNSENEFTIMQKYKIIG